MNDIGPNKVITLISPVKKRKLNSRDVDSITAALLATGIEVIGHKWLSMSEACDLFFTRGEIAQAKAVLLKNLAGEEIDFIVQPAAKRKKKMLVSDMDSTMISVECIDELADFAGLKAKIAAITEKAMHGEMDFAESLRARAMMLKGLPESLLETAYRERVKFTPGGRALVQTMKKNGAFCLLVSGGFTFFTAKVRDALGFDADEANILEIENGKLSGKVKEPILGKDAKLDFLLSYGRKHGLESTEILAVGDGANDLPMLLAAGLGAAYHAKPKVKEQAATKIDVCDLTALLYAQGYHAEEIVNY